MRYHKDVLENGLRVITVPMKDNATVTVAVAVETGANNETKEENGISHFLEHMVFKGTEKRPGKSISLELDSLGATHNAFTGDEYTGYYAKAHYKKLDKMIDVVSDIYLNPTFPQEDIDKERGVIIEEINMYRDLPQRTVFDVWEELLYGDQPAGRTILGPIKNIKKFNRQDFIDYRKKHYVPQATVVIVAGNISRRDVLKQIKNNFVDMPKGKKAKREKTKESQKTAQAKVSYKKTDQAHLVLGFRAFKLGDKRQVTLDVLNSVLGTGMSSRLFRKLRDELGLCYYVRAFEDLYTDRGFTAVRTGVTVSKTDEAIEAIMEEYKRLKEELVETKELKKAKEFVIGNMVMGLESSDSNAIHYGFQELLHQKIKTPEEIAKEIRKVTAEDIKKLANQLFKKEKLNLAIVGPFKDAKRFKKLLKI